ncbi:hydrogenase maturation protease [Candidatus Micrarchaeota archaeon]|nr:hydrogenase maturation protease [Candidatus Micrarchaeota archaeon]
MSWKDELKKLTGKKTFILCVGNEMKGDDALGRYVYDNIATDRKLFAGEMPENYISKIRKVDPDVIVIVDAIDFNERPGEIIFSNIEELEGSSLSTHSISLTVMAKMLPGIKILLLGVQPKALEFGQKMSVEVKLGGKQIIEVLNNLN